MTGNGNQVNMLKLDLKIREIAVGKFFGGFQPFGTNVRGEVGSLQECVIQSN